jgi:hypothetical protein
VYTSSSAPSHYSNFFILFINYRKHINNNYFKIPQLCVGLPRVRCPTIDVYYKHNLILFFQYLSPLDEPQSRIDNYKVRLVQSWLLTLEHWKRQKKVSSFAHGTNALMSILINATKNYTESIFEISFAFFHARDVPRF